MLQFLVTLQSFVAGRIDRDEDKGASMVEYGLLVALIAVIVAVAAALLGDAIAALFDRVTATLAPPAAN